MVHLEKGNLIKIKHKVTVLGTGNILRSDDGLGVFVVDELKQKKWPPGLLLLETGTSTLNFLGKISRSYQVIVIDAVRVGGEPGSIYRFIMEDVRDNSPGGGFRNMHDFFVPDVIRLARSMTGLPAHTVIFGMEPQDLAPGIGLTPAVEKALPKIVNMITREIMENLLGK